MREDPNAANHRWAEETPPTLLASDDGVRSPREVAAKVAFLRKVALKLDLVRRTLPPMDFLGVHLSI